MTVQINVKKIVLFIVGLSISFLVVTTFQFFKTLSEIKEALDTGDKYKLEKNINFDSLKSNLKEQFNIVLIEKMKENSSNKFAALGMAIGSKMAESMIDSIITPSGLSAVLSGSKNKSSSFYENTNKTEKVIDKKEKINKLFEESDFEYIANDRIRLTIKRVNKKKELALDEYGKLKIDNKKLVWKEKTIEVKIGLIFERDFVSWKLTKIEMPLDKMKL